MRLLDLPPGRYQLGGCKVCKVSEFQLPKGPTLIPTHEHLEDLFNSGRMKCRACHAPCGLFEVEKIDPIGARRTSVLNLRSCRG